MNSRINYNSIQVFFTKFIGTSLIDQLLDSIGMRVSDVSLVQSSQSRSVYVII
jgi:hypothetical protein